ncbi:MAG: hypothetical protein AAF799_34820 [Myxococcota bacterium]
MPNKPKDVEDLATISFGFVDDVFVIVHRAETIDDFDWGRCLREARSARELPCIVIAPGDSPPNVSHRYDLCELNERQELPLKVALLSGSTTGQRVATALKWGGVEAGCFEVEDLDGMLGFLDRLGSRARMSSALGPYLERSWLQGSTGPVRPSRRESDFATRPR